MRFRHARSLEVSGAAVWFALRWQYCRWGLFLPRVRVLKDIRHTLGYQTHPWLPNTPLVTKHTIGCQTYHEYGFSKTSGTP